MNCHHARQLISPYLDQRLTGREMLALQDHFTQCVSCERERQSLRQVKLLLRGLGEPRPPRDFSRGIAERLEAPGGPLLRWRLPPKPQRGRRLATALAFSCFTVLAVVAPFAPASRDAARPPQSTPIPPFAAPALSDASLSSAPLTPETLLPASSSFAAPRAEGLTLTSLEIPGFGPAARPPSFSAFSGTQTAAIRPH